MSKEQKYKEDLKKHLQKLEKEEAETRAELVSYQFKLEQEKKVLDRAEAAPDMMGHERRDEILSQINANIYALGDLAGMAEGRLEALDVEKTILTLRQKVASD